MDADARIRAANQPPSRLARPSRTRRGPSFEESFGHMGLGEDDDNYRGPTPSLRGSASSMARANDSTQDVRGSEDKEDDDDGNAKHVVDLSDADSTTMTSPQSASEVGSSGTGSAVWPSPLAQRKRILAKARREFQRGRESLGVPSGGSCPPSEPEEYKDHLNELMRFDKVIHREMDEVKARMRAKIRDGKRTALSKT